MTEALPLIIVCDWIPPEFGAVGQYQMAAARQAAAAGRQVTLIGLGRLNTRTHEVIGQGQLSVIRIARRASDKSNLARRAWWAIGANLALLAAAAKARPRRGPCELKVTGSPPFLSYLILLWARFARGVTVTYRITDFYPETAFAAGKVLWLKPMTPLLHKLRRRAERVEALSNCQKLRLAESGVDPRRVEVIRDGSPVSFAPDTQRGERPFGEEDVVLLYSGNLGVAHDWRTFAEAYRLHVQAGPNRVRLWLNAVGAGVAPLLEFCRRHALPVHHSEPAPLEALAGVLRAADAHLIVLGDDFWGYVIPSKIYACIESGRPCVYVGPAQSDLHMLLSGGEHHSIRNGDIDGARQALDRLECAYRQYSERQPA